MAEKATIKIKINLFFIKTGYRKFFIIYNKIAMSILIIIFASAITISLTYFIL